MEKDEKPHCKKHDKFMLSCLACDDAQDAKDECGEDGGNHYWGEGNICRKCLITRMICDDCD